MSDALWSRIPDSSFRFYLFPGGRSRPQGKGMAGVLYATSQSPLLLAHNYHTTRSRMVFNRLTVLKLPLPPRPPRPPTLPPPTFPPVEELTVVELVMDPLLQMVTRMLPVSGSGQTSTSNA